MDITIEEYLENYLAELGEKLFEEESLYINISGGLSFRCDKMYGLWLKTSDLLEYLNPDKYQAVVAFLRMRWQLLQKRANK